MAKIDDEIKDLERRHANPDLSKRKRLPDGSFEWEPGHGPAQVHAQLEKKLAERDTAKK